MPLISTSLQNCNSPLLTFTNFPSGNPSEYPISPSAPFPKSHPSRSQKFQSLLTLHNLLRQRLRHLVRLLIQKPIRTSTLLLRMENILAASRRGSIWPVFAAYRGQWSESAGTRGTEGRLAQGSRARGGEALGW
jgi:hypothetical protein